MRCCTVAGLCVRGLLLNGMRLGDVRLGDVRLGGMRLGGMRLGGTGGHRWRGRRRVMSLPLHTRVRRNMGGAPLTGNRRHATLGSAVAMTLHRERAYR